MLLSDRRGVELWRSWLGIEREEQGSLAASALGNDRKRKGRVCSPYSWSGIETWRVKWTQTLSPGDHVALPGLMACGARTGFHLLWRPGWTRQDSLSTEVCSVAGALGSQGVRVDHVVLAHDDREWLVMIKKLSQGGWSPYLRFSKSLVLWHL